jgi:hypothetical protein
LAVVGFIAKHYKPENAAGYESKVKIKETFVRSIYGFCQTQNSRAQQIKANCFSDDLRRLVLLLIELFTHFGCCDKLLLDSRLLKHLNSVLFQGFRSAAFGIRFRGVFSNPFIFVGH